MSIYEEDFLGFSAMDPDGSAARTTHWMRSLSRSSTQASELDTGRRRPIVLRFEISQAMAGSLPWNIGSATDASSADSRNGSRWASWKKGS